jgi:hypothetical protein
MMELKMDNAGQNQEWSVHRHALSDRQADVFLEPEIIIRRYLMSITDLKYLQTVI